jgi:hypothetical protein
MSAIVDAVSVLGAICAFFRIDYLSLRQRGTAMRPRIGVYWAGVFATVGGASFLHDFYYSPWFWAVAAIDALLVAGTWFAAWRVSKATLFTPLQVKVFQLAKEIRDYLTTGLSEDQLIDGYLRRFPERIRNVMFDLGEAGLPGNRVALSRYIDSVQSVTDMRDAALELDKQAVMLGNLKVC